jgi:hypothetical protein
MLIHPVTYLHGSSRRTACSPCINCMEGTAIWLDTLTTYLAEDRKCWADSDCHIDWQSRLPLSARRNAELLHPRGRLNRGDRFVDTTGLACVKVEHSELRGKSAPGQFLLQFQRCLHLHARKSRISTLVAVYRLRVS